MRRERLGPVGRHVGRAWRGPVREGAADRAGRRVRHVRPGALARGGPGGRGGRGWPGTDGVCRTWAWRDAWDATSSLSAATRSPPPAGPARRTSPAGAGCRMTCWRGRRGPQGQDAPAGGPRPRQGGAHGGADRRARMPQGRGGARGRGPARARLPPCGRRLRRRGLAHPRGHAPRRDLRPGVRRAHRRRDDPAPGRPVGPRPRPGDDGPVRGVRRGKPPDARPCRAPGPCSPGTRPCERR